MAATTTPAMIEAAARAAAVDLGLKVEVRAYVAQESERLGRLVRVRVHSTDSKATWRATIAIGKRLAGAGVGMVCKDPHSHVEVRIGSSPCTRGWANGSAAELRVYPDRETHPDRTTPAI